jgi:hypothetical protein
MKRHLAASFIATIAVTACSAPQPREPQPPIVKVTNNPPQPTTEPTAEPPPVTKELPAIPAEGPGELVREDGKCFWTYEPESAPCDEDSTCNPPPPEYYEVKCPVEDPNLPEAPKDALVQTNRDGTCFYRKRSDSHCPPGARCNPPPPRNIPVRCPTK